MMAAWHGDEVSLIVNQDASRVPQRMRQLRELSRAHSIHLKLFEGPDLDFAIRECLKSKTLKRLIIGGGDGSVNKAASLLLRLRPDVELAVLPLGTANYYAKSLHISKKLAVAFEQAVGDKIDKRQICRANKREFIIGVNVGTTSRMFAEVTDREKQQFGKLAYLRGVFRVLRKTIPPDITVKVDGKSYDFSSTELVVLSQYTQDVIKYTPDNSSTFPHFEIITYGIGKTRFSPLFAIVMFLVSFGKNQKYLKRMKAVEATITSTQQLPVAIDGDVLESLPLTIELIKKPIKFVCG